MQLSLLTSAYKQLAKRHDGDRINPQPAHHQRSNSASTPAPAQVVPSTPARLPDLSHSRGPQNAFAHHKAQLLDQNPPPLCQTVEKPSQSTLTLRCDEDDTEIVDAPVFTQPNRSSPQPK